MLDLDNILHIFGRIAKQFRLMDRWCPSVPPSVCPSVNILVNLIWLTYWNLLCDQAIPSSAVSCLVHDPRVCHDLDPRISPRSRSQWTQFQNSCLSHNSLLTCMDKLNCCPWSKGVSWPWPKVISPRSKCTQGAVVAEWLSSWLTEQEDGGSIPGLATWIFRDCLSPASKSRYGWKIAKSTLILKTTNQPTNHSAHKTKLCAQTITPHCHVVSQ